MQDNTETPLKIFILCGSAHEDSLNLKVARFIENQLKARSVEITFVHAGEEKLPPFAGYDVPYPKRVNEILKSMMEADAFYFVVPEYHRAMPSAFKNIFEYLDDEELKVSDRPAALVTATTGQWGQYSQMSMHGMLRTLGVFVLPDEMYISRAPDKMDDGGRIADEGLAERLERQIDRLLKVAELLKPLRQ